MVSNVYAPCLLLIIALISLMVKGKFGQKPKSQNIMTMIIGFVTCSTEKGPLTVTAGL